MRSHFLRFCLFACLTAQAPVLASAQSSAPRHAATDDFNRQPLAQLREGIERKHPAAFYVLAKRLFESGERDEAVFWFYAGQIRFRAHVTLKPELDRSGDPALFSSLSEVVGRPINQYAFGDVPALAQTIDRVLAWDAENDDALTPKGPARSRIVDGLRSLRADIVARQDEIRRTRTQNGLENRTR